MASSVAKSGNERPHCGDVSLTGEAQKEQEETAAAPALVSEEEASAPTTDGVPNRAIDEFDRLAVSLLALRSKGGELSLTTSSGVGSRTDPSSAAPSTPPSEMLVWIIGDYVGEMITALSALGIAPGNIRSWNNMRNSDGPRAHRLKIEQPHWLVINMPMAMREKHPNTKSASLAAWTCRIVAAMITAQVQANRHVVMYGSPLAAAWNDKAVPELRRLYSSLYLTEFRWCTMGIMDPETGKGFDPTLKVLS